MEEWFSFFQIDTSIAQIDTSIGGICTFITSILITIGIRQEEERLSILGDHPFLSMTELKKYFLCSRVSGLLNEFVDGKRTYALLVNSLYHELVHVKQQLGLDGFNSNRDSPSLEFEATYQAFKNKSLPELNTNDKDYFFGRAPFSKYDNKHTINVLASQYKTEYTEMLRSVSPDEAKKIKESIYKNTGVKF